MHGCPPDPAHNICLARDLQLDMSEQWLDAMFLSILTSSATVLASIMIAGWGQSSGLMTCDCGACYDTIVIVHDRGHDTRFSSARAVRESAG